MATALFPRVCPNRALQEVSCEETNRRGLPGKSDDIFEADKKPPNFFPEPVENDEKQLESSHLFRRLFSKPRAYNIPVSPTNASTSSNTTEKWAATARETVNYLCSKYGYVGLSAGILNSSGQTVINFGALDAVGGKCTSKDTVYLTSSMTKPIIALAVAIMANDPRFGTDLTTEVKDIFPEIGNRTFLRHAERQLVVADLIDNRTEFMKTTNLWECPEGDIPWKTARPILSLLGQIPLSDRFQHAQDFVHARNYSNEGFALAAVILEKRTGMSWPQFVRERILKPLGMTSTIAGLTPLDEVAMSHRIAKSYSVSVKEPMEIVRGSLQRAGLSDLSYDTAYRIAKHQLPAVAPIGVKTSQVTWATEDLQSTPLGAAAGIMSSLSDLLKFYAKFIEVYHLPSSAIGRDELSEVELGMVTVKDHIQDMVKGTTCAYAAGWSTATVPWEPSLGSSKPRWPGADGDNARRLERAIVEPGVIKLRLSQAWPFFQRGSTEQPPRLVLSHGGNMIGATSFCMIDLQRRRVAVVLSNTRGFFVDVPNLIGMLLSSYGEPEFEGNCGKVKELAHHIAARYLWDTYRYETALLEQYPLLADPEKFSGCIGRYNLTDQIFATVSVSHAKSPDPADDAEAEEDSTAEGNTGSEKCLVFRLYGEGYAYPMRVRTGTSWGGPIVKMTFATSMNELVPTGVGGNNRLNVEDFELEFRCRVEGRFQELIWNFDRAGSRDTDPGVFTFSRTLDSGEMAQVGN